MGEDRRPPVDRATLLRMLTVGLVAAAAGIAIGLTIHWFPVQGSSQSRKIDTFWDVLIICSVPFFVLVSVIVLTAVIKFRMRPGEEELDGPPIHGNTRLEVIWTSLPALLLVSLSTYAYIVLHDIEKAPAAGNELKVQVYGEQFTWTFGYTAPGGKKVMSPQLYVPKDRSVKFFIHSKDVLHDFWVPQWRMKIDAVPGITTSYRVTPIRLGTFPVVCAELCGLGHAFMRQQAHVLPEQQFDAWLQKQTQPAAAAGGAAGGAANAAAAGKQVFLSNGCGGCHTLADAGATGSVGPNLDKNIATDPASAIKQSIVKPNADIATGYPANVMPPNFGQTIKPADLDALVQYLVKVTHK